jgi:hypothetical protein
MLPSDETVADIHTYNRREERVTIVCPEHARSRFLFGAEFILNSDNALIRKMATGIIHEGTTATCNPICVARKYKN